MTELWICSLFTVGLLLAVYLDLRRDRERVEREREFLRARRWRMLP